MAFLKHVSVFEIYRLSGAIQNELENPQRLAKVNHKIKEGDFVGFYHQNYGEHIAGCVERLNQKSGFTYHTRKTLAGILSTLVSNY